MFSAEKLITVGAAKHSAKLLEKWITGVIELETFAVSKPKEGETFFKTLFTPEKPPI